MNDVYICDAVRTLAATGALSTVRADDLGAVPIAALIERNPHVDWTAFEDAYYGCANH
ncbi:MAG: hypothetical protein AAEI92_10095 [Arenicellales bacterium]